MHTTRQSVPRLVVLDVLAKRRVTTTTVFRTGPLGAGHNRNRSCLNILEGDVLFFVAFGHFSHVSSTDALLQSLEATGGQGAIGGTREAEDELACSLVGVHSRTRSHKGIQRSFHRDELVDFLLSVESDALRCHSSLLDERADGVVLVGNRAVIAKNRDELGHVHTGNPANFFTRRDATVRGQQFVRRIVGQRSCNNVLHGLRQVNLSHLRHVGRQVLEELKVGTRIPRRIDRSIEGVHVGVHIRAGEVVLLVPGGSGKNNIRVQGGRGVAEVRGDHEVELAIGRGITPHHRLGTISSSQFGSLNIIICAQHVAHEELSTLSGGTQQVRTPVEEDTREVDRVIGIFTRELQGAFGQLTRDVLANTHARFFGCTSQFQGGAVERGESGHPAALGSLNQGIGNRLVTERLTTKRRGQTLSAQTVVAPLIGGEVPETGRDHLACGTLPVKGEGELGPAGQRTNLFLADVVCPSTTVDALGSTEGGQSQHRAVDLVSVVEVVDARAEDDLRTTV